MGQETAGTQGAEGLPWELAQVAQPTQAEGVAINDDASAPKPPRALARPLTSHALLLLASLRFLS